MIEYYFVDKNTVSWTAKDIIIKAGTKDWIFTWEIMWELVFYKKVSKSIPRSEVLKAKEQDWYNKWKVFWLCKYAFDKDFEEKYLEWREERKLNPKAKIFSENSERLLFWKFSKHTKVVAMAMLDNAIEMKYLSVYELQESEKTKLLDIERKRKKAEEERLQWLKNEEELMKAKAEKIKIEKILAKYPEIKEQAILEVEKSTPNVKWWFKEALINAKMKVIAKNNPKYYGE